MYTSPNVSSRSFACACSWQSPDILGKIIELRNAPIDLRQFDIRETPFMNKYGNTNSFIIIFGSGHFNGREVRGKSSSVTTHRIPRKVTAVFYEFAIIQCQISQFYMYMKRVCEQYFNHVQSSEGNGKKINGYILKEKYQAFYPSLLPTCCLRRKTGRMPYPDHISSANHRLKSRHISRE